MQLSEKYNPQEVEQRQYQFWMDNNYFHSTPDDRPAYSIVIPPPNVTGILHMGHMLNNTIQDVLIRRARMQGFNACWVPGTDHASIATEAKVVAKLKAEGINKNEIGREEFLKHAWDWTHQYGGTILSQLKKLGCSCDWERTRFTMEDKLSQSVIKSFVELYNQGLIYRDYKMINWDPEAQTNISDEEVIFKEQQSKLFFIKYKIEGSEAFISVATTRPETIFGDVAICVNPNDERFTHLKGKKVIVPIVNRAIPIIEDDYVDMEFGTGCLKITPAHDLNDYAIGKKHGLEIIDCMDNHAKLNEHALHYQGQDRFVVRKAVAKELQEKDLLIKTEEHPNKVGTSERTGAVIEPKISVQWFLKMQELAKPALDVVMNDEIKFHPEKFKNTYRHWMENVHDWNISRQLWWGQQIPAYFYGPNQNDFVVAETKEEALVLAQKATQTPALTLADLTQDPDALDTWFSSWLWPISVFDGMVDENNADINYYYPTGDLVTGPDIIFFWVARMVVAGLKFKQEIPFKNVYFTGIVRDKQRRKMSESLGNSPDPIELIEKYGADGVRVGILLSSAAGNDLLFDEDLMLQGRNFATKIWNAYRLTQSWTKEDKAESPEALQAHAIFEANLNKTIIEIKDQFEKFRISDALHLVYKLVWDDFCAWYLEIIKPAYGQAIAQATFDKAIAYFEELLKLLHPFTPFISEELWQHISPRSLDEALIVSQQKQADSYDAAIIQQFETTKSIVSGIRNYRQSKGVSPKESVELFTNVAEFAHQAIVQKLANLSQIHFATKTDLPNYSFLVEQFECSIPLSEKLDLAEEKSKAEDEIKYLKGFLISVDKKLGNEKFMASAPAQVVEAELKKQSDALQKIALLEEKIKSL